jgi:hypothetical protein
VRYLTGQMPAPYKDEQSFAAGVPQG